MKKLEVIFGLLFWLTKPIATVPITLGSSQILQKSSGTTQFATNNLFVIGFDIYSLFGYGFNKASLNGGTQFALLNLNGFVSAFPLSPFTTVEAIPGANRFIYINPTGGVYIIDPNNPTTPLVSNTTLLYFGDSWQNTYCYQIEQKPNTNYFYVTSLVGKALQKIDVTNLNNVVRIISGPTNDLGYEMISISPNNVLATVSANGVRVDIYDLNTDAFSKTLAIPVASLGAAYRCARNYPLTLNTAFFFITRTDGKAYLVNSLTSTVDKIYAISATMPDSVKHLSNTRWMVIAGGSYLEFFNMDGTDADTKQHLFAGTPNIVYAAMEFGQLTDTSYVLAASFLFPTGQNGGLSTTATYVFNLGTEFCHVACNGCTRSMDDGYCSTCATGFTISGGRCLPSPPPPYPACAAGQYRTVGGVCSACPLNCGACTDYTGYCTTCTTGKILPQGTCSATCGSTSYPQTTGGKDYCFNCHPSCLTCNGGTNTQCQTCDTAAPASFTTSGTSCVDKCNAELTLTTYVAKTTSCSQCTGVGDCKTCSYPGLSYSCVQCKSGYLYNGLCVASCPTGLITNTVAKTCEACEEKGPNSYFFQGACVSSCPAGYTLTKMQCLNSSQTGTNTNTNPFGTSGGGLTSSTGSTSLDTTAKAKEVTAAESSSSSGGFSLFAIIGLALVVVIVAGILIYFKCIRKSKQVAPLPGQPNSHMSRPSGQGQVEDYHHEEDYYEEEAPRQPQYHVQKNQPPPMHFVDFSKRPSLKVIGGQPAPLPGQHPVSNPFEDDWAAPEPLPYQPKMMMTNPKKTILAESQVSELQPIGNLSQMGPGQPMFGGNNQPNPFRPPQMEASLMNTNQASGPSRRLVSKGRNL